MIKKVSISVFLTLCILRVFSQDQDSLMTETAHWLNGEKKYHYIFSTGIHDYDFTYWHPNGSLHAKGYYYDGDTYINNSWDRDGKPLVVDGFGHHVNFYENGQKKNEGFVKNSLMDSLWIEYYPNGQMKSKGHYLKSLGHSRENGMWTYWYENGQVESTGRYKDGLKKEVWTYYHRNGQKRAEILGSEFMNRGKYLMTWDINGEETLNEGKGFYYEYSSQNKPSLIIQISDSIKDTANYFFPNGNPMQTIKYLTNSNRTSWWHKFHLIECWDTLGNQIASNGTGWQYEYFENGNLSAKNYYTNGVNDSTSVAFYQNGRIKEINTYENGNWTYRVTYFNNGNKFQEFDVYNIPVVTNTHSTQWWYNGNLKRKESLDSIIEYHPNGQIKAVGYFCMDTLLDEKTRLNRDYFLTSESEENSFSIVSYEPYQWKRTWYSDGAIKSEVLFDSTSSALVMTLYHKSGNIKSVGKVKYDTWEIVPESNDFFKQFDQFKGYLKFGVWKYYDQYGNLIDERNFDLEAVESRKI